MLIKEQDKIAAEWAHCEETACGLELFARPCHRICIDDWADRSFPLDNLCKSTKEAVFVVEDCEEQRNAIAEVVELAGYEPISCATAAELQAQIGLCLTGCILLDIGLPEFDGIAVQEWLQTAGIQIPVIFMSGIADVSVAVHCMKRGAADFLPKPFTEVELRNAITAAVGVSRKLNCRKESVSHARALVQKLTPMELKVAGMISIGFPTRAIASMLGRSENTVKIHRHRIFNKFSVISAASVVHIMRHARDYR